VLGHGRCGGIQAALDPAAEPLSPGDFIGKWMGLLAPVSEAVATDQGMTQSQRQTALERISIRHSIENLRSFPCVSILERKGRLHLHGAWFDISSGELWVMDPHSNVFAKVDMVA
jgi:carbonic anhydrase